MAARQRMGFEESYLMRKYWVLGVSSLQNFNELVVEDEDGLHGINQNKKLYQINLKYEDEAELVPFDMDLHFKSLFAADKQWILENYI